MEGNGDSKRKSCKEIEIENPFICDPSTYAENLYDKIKTAILTVFLLPIRVVCIVVILLLGWSLSFIGLYGYSREDLMLKPLSGWRRKIRTIVGYFFRSIYFAGSVHWVTVKGKLASPEKAPILVAAPHSSFFDVLAVIKSGPSSAVGKVEAADIPFYGKLIDLAQPIYVCREDHNSRATTIQEILKRVKDLKEWGEIGRCLIFPEGTCTNKKSLIQFKLGAFHPGQPIQPVLIRYPNKVDTATWTWQGPSISVLLWRTLAQFHTAMEIEYLPVYIPNEDEKKDAKLFARNVQQLMSKALNIPISDYAFDDCKLMEYAQRCKYLFASKIADVAKLREKIGIATSNIEEVIVRNSFNGTEDHFVDFEEFVSRMKIPANDYSFTLFRLFTETNDTVRNVIDFKEYLNHTLLLIKNQEAKIELVKLLFMLHGKSGRLQREPLHCILNHFLKLTSSKINKLFYSLDTANRGSIVFEDFYKATQDDINYKRLFEPNRNFRLKLKNKG